MSPDLGTSPLDARMTGLYRKTPLTLRAVRIGLEVLGLVVGTVVIARPSGRCSSSGCSSCG